MTVLRDTAGGGHPHRRHPPGHARHPPRARDPRGPGARTRRDQLRDRRDPRRAATPSGCRRAQQATPGSRPHRRRRGVCCAGATRVAAPSPSARRRSPSSSTSSWSAHERRASCACGPSIAMSEPRTISLLPWQVTLAEFTQKAAEVGPDGACCAFVVDSIHPAGRARRLRVTRDGVLACRRAGLRARRRRGTGSGPRWWDRLGKALAERVLAQMRRLALELTLTAGVALIGDDPEPGGQPPRARPPSQCPPDRSAPRPDRRLVSRGR